MTERPLPGPINGTERYLAAVHDRLDKTNTLLAQILGRMPVQPKEQEPSDVVELREPATGQAEEPATTDTADAPGEELREPSPPPRATRKRTSTKKGLS